MATHALTTDVELAGRLLGFGRSQSYERVRAGTFPGAISIGGRRYRVSLFALAKELGCTIDDVRAQLIAIERATDDGPAAA
jgi:hypothetical protein